MVSYIHQTDAITHNETNKDKLMTTSNANNATNLGKKRRLSNAEETYGYPLPKKSIEVESVDAKTFLFRSPAPREEIDEIAAKIKSQIDAAQTQISELGIEAYRRLKSGRERGKGGVDGGVDTDDELIQDEKAREEAIALEEAVVRGNPRRLVLDMDVTSYVQSMFASLYCIELIYILYSMLNILTLKKKDIKLHWWNWQRNKIQL